MAGLWSRLFGTRPAARRAPARGLPINLVGEQHCAEAIAGCRRGDVALVWHEADNPDDDGALAVTDEQGRLLGYVPRYSFLRQAIHDDGKGCEARLRQIGPGVRGFNEVRIAVVLDDSEIQKRRYEGAVKSSS